MTATAGLVDNHRFVLEPRDATGRFLFFRTHFSFVIVESVVPVTSNVTADTTWTSNNTYLLDYVAVFVAAGKTGTSPPAAEHRAGRRLPSGHPLSGSLLRLFSVSSSKLDSGLTLCVRVGGRLWPAMARRPPAALAQQNRSCRKYGGITGSRDE